MPRPPNPEAEDGAEEEFEDEEGSQEEFYKDEL